jgi:hypothetical protein
LKHAFFARFFHPLLFSLSPFPLPFRLVQRHSTGGSKEERYA